MALSSDMSSFPDVEAFLDRALASPYPISLTFPTAGRAVHFRQRCYRYRVLNRKFNAEAFGYGHELYGRSAYDNLVIDIDGTRIRASAEAPPIMEVELPDGTRERIDIAPMPRNEAAKPEDLSLDLASLLEND